jgi:alanyl-tRNA synthetase
MYLYEVIKSLGFRFRKEMKKQKQRAREARDDKGFHREKKDRVYINMKNEIERTDFTGYRNYEVETDIRVILKNGEKVDSLAAGETGEILLKRTPFYAESGGQVGDTGILKSDGKLAQIIDTYRKSELIVHQVKVEKGKIEQGEIIKACVFKCRRKATSRNHSCTHLLHKALKTIIGEHVNQSGSMVSPEKLRFDFSHYDALTDEELEKIETRVNKKIIDNLAVETLETTLEKAKDIEIPKSTKLKFNF